jgi:DNA-binding NarL/FixJ family response regulator
MGGETDLAPHALFPLAVVDDHALRRAAFSGLLAETLSAEVAAFGTADELLLTAVGGGPAGWVCRGGSQSVVVLSVGDLPFATNGVWQTVGQLRTHFPRARLALLVDHVRRVELAKAARAGVRGLIPTSLKPEAVCRAVRTISAGGVFFPAFPRRHFPARPPGRVRRAALN